MEWDPTKVLTIREGFLMFKLPVRTWILNAAAVLSGRHGAVARQAEQAECSRETVYQHARKVEQRLTPEPSTAATLAELRAENQRLRQVIAEQERQAEGRGCIDKDQQRRLATTAFAMGLSRRQVGELPGLLLPATKTPDHSTLGHWVQAEAEQAGRVLKIGDARCALRVQTLCVDEIFFGGGRPSSGSSRRA